MDKIIIRNGEMYRLAYPDILVWDKDSDDWLCCSPISSLAYPDILDPCDQDEMRMVMRCLDYPNVHLHKGCYVGIIHIKIVLTLKTLN